MIIGFTGTRQGMTNRQKMSVMSLMNELEMSSLHHGDCIGADEEAHSIAVLLGLTSDQIIIHPPINEEHRAFCKGTILPARTYLVRNYDIVNACDFLIAAPKERQEIQRSGTWATVRCARKIDRNLLIFFRRD